MSDWLKKPASGEAEQHASSYAENLRKIEEAMRVLMQIPGYALTDGVVATAAIADGAVTGAKLAAGSVDESTISLTGDVLHVPNLGITTNKTARDQAKFKQYHTFVFTSVADATYPKLHGTQLTASLAVPNVRACFITNIRVVNQAGTEYYLDATYGDNSLAAGVTWTPYIVEDTGTFYMHIVVNGSDTYDFANGLSVTGTTLVVTVEIEAADTN